MDKRHWLITAFEPFAGRETNNSKSVLDEIKKLEAKNSGSPEWCYTFHYEVLPVEYDGCFDHMSATIKALSQSGITLDGILSSVKVTKSSSSRPRQTILMMWRNFRTIEASRAQARESLRTFLPMRQFLSDSPFRLFRASGHRTIPGISSATICVPEWPALVKHCRDRRSLVSFMCPRPDPAACSPRMSVLP